MFPFVTPLMNPTSGVSITPTLIFGNDAHTCFIDSILVTNTSNSTINIFVSVAREQTEGIESYFSLAYKAQLLAGTCIDILQDKALTFEAGDLLYANCDSSGGSFDVFVVYRELSELPALSSRGY